MTNEEVDEPYGKTEIIGSLDDIRTSWAELVLL